MVLELKLHCYVNGNTWRPANDGSMDMLMHLMGVSHVDENNQRAMVRLNLLAQLHNVSVRLLTC